MSNPQNLKTMCGVACDPEPGAMQEHLVACGKCQRVASLLVRTGARTTLWPWQPTAAAGSTERFVNRARSEGIPLPIPQYSRPSIFGGKQACLVLAYVVLVFAASTLSRQYRQPPRALGEANPEAIANAGLPAKPRVTVRTGPTDLPAARTRRRSPGSNLFLMPAGGRQWFSQAEHRPSVFVIGYEGVGSFDRPRLLLASAIPLSTGDLAVTPEGFSFPEPDPSRPASPHIDWQRIRLPQLPRVEAGGQTR